MSNVQTEKETGRVVEQMDALPETVEEVEAGNDAPPPDYEGLARPEHFGWWGERVRLTPENTEGERKTEGGLFVTAKNLPVATVVEPEHLAGRRVLYRQYHGDKVVLNGEPFIIVEPQYILMFLSDGTKVEEVDSA